VTVPQLKRLIAAAGRVIEENKDLLTELDSAIGDGDHGINMARGFAAVGKVLEEEGTENPDAGGLLKTVGMTLVSTVGGASGPLYGTAFLRAGAVLTGRETLTGEDLVKALGAALEGIKQRGSAQPGDKTMVDALEPAHSALSDALEAHQDLGRALDEAVAAARTGMEYTKDIIARKGRASYLGERSIGHQDPGATSSYLIIKAVRDFLAG